MNDAILGAVIAILGAVIGVAGAIIAALIPDSRPIVKRIAAAVSVIMLILALIFSGYILIKYTRAFNKSIPPEIPESLSLCQHDDQYRLKGL